MQFDGRSKKNCTNLVMDVSAGGEGGSGGCAVDLIFSFSF